MQYWACDGKEDKCFALKGLWYGGDTNKEQTNTPGNMALNVQVPSTKEDLDLRIREDSLEEGTSEPRPAGGLRAGNQVPK